MAALKQTEKRWIVEQLAVFETPQQVAEAFHGEFSGRSIDRQQVANYDASKPWARTRMAKALVALFDETRERFKSETEDIAIANKAYRLKQLDRIARETRSPKLQMEAMEQAAKEVGESYTNTQKLRHTGKDDDTPIQSEARVLVTMPDNGRGDRVVDRPIPPAGDDE